jgi:RNA polymerase sigma-54 factor
VNLQLYQRQQITLTAQLYQAINLMELPLLDLREKIAEELENNPALEVEKDVPEVSLDDVPLVNEEDDYFEAVSDPGFGRVNGEEAADEKLKFIEGALTREESLEEHLLSQLRLEPLDKQTCFLCENLIQNIDADGFHIVPVEELLESMNERAGKGMSGAEAVALDKTAANGAFDKAALDKALRIVQALDPLGCCTAGYEESLRVQVGLSPDAPEGTAAALSCLELFYRGKFDEAARKIGRSEEEAQSCFAYIKMLNPFPGRQFASNETRFVVPDVLVVRRDGGFSIILNDEEIPVLGLSPFFMKIAGEKSKKQARDFAKENLKEARWFVRSITQRNHTLLRVSRAVVEFQKAFFERGPGNLAPLTQQTIAEELELHESTVSRIANGKYIQTEWGIYPIKYFFTNSVSKSSAGPQFSKEGVKEIIRSILSNEERHFSDQEIAGLLAKRGIPLARRTVAKYRKELDVGSSYVRQ